MGDQTTFGDRARRTGVATRAPAEPAHRCADGPQVEAPPADTAGLTPRRAVRMKWAVAVACPVGRARADAGGENGRTSRIRGAGGRIMVAGQGNDPVAARHPEGP